ncbi:MAG: DNA translocase FtsK [Chloroflexi bacterium]|nr:DNA translocase FtsK [Chloroflexota bacterium]
MPISRKPKRSSGRKTPSTSTSSRGRSGTQAASRRRGASPPPPRPSLWESLPPERKVDLFGILLALLGLLTLLSLFSVDTSSLTGSWRGMLSTIFGWGIYILPFGLILLGAWLVARNVDRLPPLSVERGLGIALLFFNLLVVLHALSGPATDYALNAQLGRGGGYLGSFILQALVAGLGGGGAAIVVLAWLVISLTMTLDLSVQELFAWTAPLAGNLKQRWQERRARSSVPPPAPAAGREIPGAESRSDGFTPLERPASAQVNFPPAAALPPLKAAPSAPAIHWTLPPVKEILELGQAPAVNAEFVEQRARLIEETLASFGAPSQVVEISRGPTVTMFGVEPLFIETRNGRTRVRVSKIVALADDLALALAAPRIRIQAPVPGRNYVGIEVPNEEMTLVSLREVIESDVFARQRTSLRFALGKDVSGHPIASDLASMPHILIAGATGSGKSVCVNAILSGFLLNNTPDDLRLILVDPKRVELTGYNGIPHLLAPVVVEIERVVGALQWMTREMDNRYHRFAEVGARNITDFNGRMAAQGGKKLPYLVVVIDELADLMMIAPDETERTITRLAQLARATGIHLVIATQRPSVDVVTGLIKANFPARIAFAVASNTDSRVILDQPGAERLLGRGDMLFQAPDAAAPVRLQGVFVSDGEIQRLVDYWRQQAGQTSAYAVPGGVVGGTPVDAVPQGIPLRPPVYEGKQALMFEDMSPQVRTDPLLDDAIDLVRREGRASVSMLQRRFRIGYTRAARLVDTMEEQGVVGPPEGGTGVRQVLDYGPAAPPPED